MESVKSQIIKIIEDQPEDSSFEEILKELAFAKMIEKGLADSDKGNLISNEEMNRRIKSWQK